VTRRRLGLWPRRPCRLRRPGTRPARRCGVASAPTYAGWQPPLDDLPLPDRNCGDFEVRFEGPGLVGFGGVCGAGDEVRTVGVLAPGPGLELAERYPQPLALCAVCTGPIAIQGETTHPTCAPDEGDVSWDDALAALAGITREPA
jgi:hypothetical protein